MRIHRIHHLLALAVATCAATWSVAGVAIAMPADAKPIVAQGGHPPTIGDHSVPDREQVDANLAALERERNQAEAATPVADTDTETVALVLSIVAIVTALGAVTLIVTRSRGRVLGT